MEDAVVARTKEVYEIIRDKIVSGNLRPNEALIEDDLANAFMVSRTPIRESFQRLYRDGLIIPRKRGWQVKEFKRAEVQENYEVRADLEGLAARLAAVRGSPEHKSNIQRIHRDRLNLNSTSVTERVRSNRELHDAIAEAAQNKRLASLIAVTQNFYFNARTASQASSDSFERAQVEHDQIVEAIVRGDADRAHNSMRAHILRALAVWLNTTDLP
jgi:DNA-binding GntR family transcriptional regulator